MLFLKNKIESEVNLLIIESSFLRHFKNKICKQIEDWVEDITLVEKKPHKLLIYWPSVNNYHDLLFFLNLCLSIELLLQ